VDDEARREFEARLTTIGFDESKLETVADGTLFVPMDPTEDASALPSIVGGDLEMKQPLGQGGMGIVNLARQRAMARDVAVKRVLPERRGAASELLIEARVMGNLEHPNVVPVYSLGTDDEGEVLFVMKRISGTAWSDRLRHGDGDLERELRVLLEVCRAIHYAHERGLLHRDLKPSNVMLGHFGEVYVLDWGLAVAIGERGPPGVPKASEVSVVTGTPAYMAPEMAMPEGKLDRRTDVYLLGALLHELLTGRPPHDDSGSLQETLHTAFLAKPPALDDVDEEIADVCRKALARERDERYATAAELSAAVEDYLSHAAARQLIKVAEARRARVGEHADDDDGDVAAQRAFDEARFAYEQALEVWPAARAARDGRADLQRRMVERELRRDRADNAALILSGMNEPPSELQARVEEAKQAREAERAKAEKLAFNVDIRVGAVSRSVTVGALGVVWAGLMVTLYAMYGAEPPYAPVLAYQSGSLLLFLSALVFVRKRLIGNRVSWQLAMIVLGATVCSTTTWFWSWYEAWPIARAVAISHLFVGFAAVMGANIDRRLLWAWHLQTAAFLATFFFPAHAFLLSGLLGGASLISVALARGRG
jgi:serine/threonine-protein kinase